MSLHFEKMDVISMCGLLQGLCTGIFILLTTGGKSSHILVFSEDLFFIYLLPPIIFNAGWVVYSYLATLSASAFFSYSFCFLIRKKPDSLLFRIRKLVEFAALFILIFNRFQVKKKQFFRNFMTIMLFGAVGTLISFAIISLGNFNQWKFVPEENKTILLLFSNSYKITSYMDL